MQNDFLKKNCETCDYFVKTCDAESHIDISAITEEYYHFWQVSFANGGYGCPFYMEKK